MFKLLKNNSTQKIWKEVSEKASSSDEIEEIPATTTSKLDTITKESRPNKTNKIHCR